VLVQGKWGKNKVGEKIFEREHNIFERKVNEIELNNPSLFPL